jgi:hypothetical protein
MNELLKGLFIIISSIVVIGGICIIFGYILLTIIGLIKRDNKWYIYAINNSSNKLWGIVKCFIVGLCVLLFISISFITGGGQFNNLKPNTNTNTNINKHLLKYTNIITNISDITYSPSGFIK